MKRSLLLFALLASTSTICFSQAKTTASRVGDLQVGGGLTIGKPDYTDHTVRGGMIYADFDLREHIGVEVDFHQVNDPNTDIYERSYEFGGRYFRQYGRYKPYVKAMYGRGVFNFPAYYLPTGPNTFIKENANLAYNMFVGGGGVDIEVHPRINVRADFEYQYWLSGPGLSDGLNPTLFSVGVAYHFPAGKPR